MGSQGPSINCFAQKQDRRVRHDGQGSPDRQRLGMAEQIAAEGTPSFALPCRFRFCWHGRAIQAAQPAYDRAAGRDIAAWSVSPSAAAG
jgi:hypothetical protein